MISIMQSAFDSYLRAHILQDRIDAFLTTNKLRTVSDIQYYPQDGEAVVLRKRGYRNVNIDVSDTASPSEALERIIQHAAVY